MNIHLVFHTKQAIPMRKEDLRRIHDYIGGIIKGMGENPIAIGGTENHVHILCTLPKGMPLTDFVRTIKAESSRWVSASKIDVIKAYIHNQEEHHRTITFKEEYIRFLEAYHKEYDERYLETD